MCRAAPAAALIRTVTENPVIAGNGVVGMQAGSGPVAAVVGADIAVTGAGCPCRIETAVACFLAGIARSTRAGIAAVHTVAACAGIVTVAKNAVSA